MHNTPNAVVDPGFPRGGGANSKGGCKKLLFGQFFPKNCMKLKELGLGGGGHIPGAPLDLPMKRIISHSGLY